MNGREFVGGNITTALLRRYRIVVALALAVVVVSYSHSGVTTAQQSGAQTLVASDVQAQSTVAYWTAERLASARPLTPMATSLVPEDTTAQAGGTPQFADGRAPTVNVAARTAKLYDPETIAPEEGIEPQDAGTFGADFTSSRLVPATQGTAKAYPYRTVGKLFFTTPSGNSVCSASVIQRRILATAGHCVHSGNGSATGWFSNFLFVPATFNGLAPYQSWNWNTVIVSGEWFNGGGGVPNAADYAMIQVSDRPFGEIMRRIGDVVGWLGWQTFSLSDNHTTQLGYPCNFDSCQQMHQVTSDSFQNTAPNNVEYGSDARGGSSGGPWVQNFGLLSVGQTGGVNPGRNRVVGITSYGYVSVLPKVQGASILNNTWVNIWNLICGPVGSGDCS